MNNTSVFDNNNEISWCPGCGNFNILKALKKAFLDLSLKPKDIYLISGIGQAAKLPHFINTNGFNSLHGRALPVAFGAHCTNPNLNIFAITGDGDGYGEGGNHFIHGIRKNFNIVHMVHNNQIYGLTKGQASPTTLFNQRTTLQLNGVKQEPLNPIALAISLNCSFVARSFSGDTEHLISVIKEAYNHKGYSLIDILQPCVSFNKVNTYKWYNDRIYYLNDTYDPYNKIKAFQTSQKFGDEGIPLGIIYKSSKSTYLDRFPYKKEILNINNREIDYSTIFSKY